uniref:DNA topoisomerase (ATP-hydrolyzing) n=1 Tax=Cajanus cajan TaxID=3821 RepID=A0A151RC11_CAJCA|nr:DNA topoisomerase 2 [Cajanus cajan]
MNDLDHVNFQITNCSYWRSVVGDDLLGKIDEPPSLVRLLFQDGGGTFKRDFDTKVADLVLVEVTKRVSEVTSLKADLVVVAEKCLCDEVLLGGKEEEVTALRVDLAKMAEAKAELEKNLVDTERAVLFEHKRGFLKVARQARLLAPGVDLSAMHVEKELRFGKLEQRALQVKVKVQRYRGKAFHSNGTILSSYSMPEYEPQREKLGNNANGWKIKYYKGVKDHASARYMYTELNTFTRCIFHEYLNEDGKSIEPNWYLVYTLFIKDSLVYD